MGNLDNFKKVAALVAIGFFFGALVTYAMSGLESGSKADWAAAAGTWVIGIAACALTFMQVRSAFTARHSDEVRQLKVISARAATLCIIADRFKNLDKSQPLNSSSPRTLIGALERRCASLNLDLALIDIDEDLEVAVSHFDYNVTATESICGVLLGISDGRQSGSVGTVSEFTWLLKQIESLISTQRNLQGEVERRIAEIEKRGMMLLK